MSNNLYDQLAPCHHFLCGDGDAAVRTQGEAIARLLHMHGVRKGELVLDAACGIGTQTLGLLIQGHEVIAAD